jgi:peptidoglycan/xylan/chitin deacetylase (PgdA/CDA1 family)
MNAFCGCLAVIIVPYLKKSSTLTVEVILNLHGIGSPHHGVPSDEPFYWVTKQAFASLLDDVVASRATSSVPTALTFDDGNESDAKIALPALTKRGLKAAFFILAGRIGTPHYLDRKALSDLMSAGMEIGTHGMNHLNWRKLDETALNVEITDARRRIEDTCGIAITKAAIPFGSYDRRVLKRLRNEGFKSVYTSDGGLAKADAWLKPRETLNGFMSETDIRSLLTTYPTLRARLRRSAARIYKELR